MLTTSLSCLAADGPRPEATSRSVATADDAARADALIKLMASGGFQARESAEQALKGLSRAAIPSLEKYAVSDDPEIKGRIVRVIECMMSDPGKIPQRFVVFSAEVKTTRETWDGSMATWRRTSKPNAGNEGDEQETTVSGTFAQSFVARAGTISAVELCIYPYRNGPGWMRVDLCENDENWPSAFVIARAWVRFEHDRMNEAGAWLAVPLGTNGVKTGTRYWLTFTHYLDPPAAPADLVMIGCTKKDRYVDGQWSDANSAFRQHAGDLAGLDALFRVVSECGAPPGLRDATQEELKTLPATPESRTSWRSLYPLRAPNR